MHIKLKNFGLAPQANVYKFSLFVYCLDINGCNTPIPERETRILQRDAPSRR